MLRRDPTGGASAFAVSRFISLPRKVSSGAPAQPVFSRPLSTRGARDDTAPVAITSTTRRPSTRIPRVGADLFKQARSALPSCASSRSQMHEALDEPRNFLSSGPNEANLPPTPIGSVLLWLTRMFESTRSLNQQRRASIESNPDTTRV